MSVDSDVNFLRRSPLFANFADEQLRLLALSSECVTLPKGQELFQEGQWADSAYLIADGQIKLDRSAKGERIGMGVYRTGSMLGERALFIEKRWSARATAQTDSELLMVRRSLFRRFLQEFPEIARHLQRYMANRLARTNQELSRLGENLGKIQPDTIIGITDYLENQPRDP